MGEVADTRALADRVAIYELKYRCCRAIDTNNLEAITDVFTPDARLEAVRFGETEPHLSLHGHDELERIAQGEAVSDGQILTQHRPYNPVITIDEDTASGEWYVSVVSLDETHGVVSFTIGTYQDSYRRVDGDWKISATRSQYAETELATV
jgi:hypothetical protein